VLFLYGANTYEIVIRHLALMSGILDKEWMDPNIVNPHLLFYSYHPYKVDNPAATLEIVYFYLA